jgi:site-specific recombinase XerC
VLLVELANQQPSWLVSRMSRDLYQFGTKNLRAVQLLLGHTKLESTVRYLGIEVDDALEMAEQTEV